MTPTALPEAADVVVVGGGLAGLVAADRLQAAGARVVVFDKDEVPGGRVATRRFDAAAFDSGAQFFTVRSDEFRSLVEAWISEGCPIVVWSHGLAQCEQITDGPQAATTGRDGHPRFVVGGGLNGLPRHVAAGLDVRLVTRVANVAAGRTRWTVTLTTGASMAADAVVLTPPVPQSLELVTAGHVHVPPWARERLESIDYDPCLALLALLDGNAAIPPPGGVQFAGGPVQFLGDNAAKGTSAQPGLTVHLRGDVSRARFAELEQTVATEVLGWLAPWLGGATVRAWQLKRWRYAQPIVSDDDRALRVDVDGAPLVFAGDAFCEAKIEGATRSGLAAARALGAT